MPGSPVVDIQNSFGPAFIGLQVGTTLFGLTIVQTWIYFWNYRKRDPKALKILIVFITAMDTLHTILCCYMIYWYLVLNFGNVENLDYSMWAMDLQVIISIFVGVSVQLYYAKRVYTVSQSIISPIIIVTLVVVAASSGFLFTTKEAILKQFSRLHSLTWITCVGMTATALADLLIAAAMCWSLYRRRTGFARTDSILMTLMAYSINSGLLTCLLAVAMTISFVVSPSSLIWLSFYWAMSKCHVNSLLAMLNSRDYVRDRSVTSNPENALNLSSIRIEPSSDAFESKSGQADTVHRSTALNFARNKSGHDVEPALRFEVPKPGASITAFQSQDQISESST